MGDPKPRHDHELAGGLRRLVTRLQEGELLVMRRWINEELHLLKTPRLRLLRTPSYSKDEPLPNFDGSFFELAGQVRRLLTELPEDRLIVLHAWVSGKLRERKAREGSDHDF